MATRPHRNSGQGFTQFGALNAQLQQAVVNFASLVSGATLFGQTIGAFREFEKQLVLTNSVAGGTIQQFRQMEQATRQFALATSVSATEAASALYFLASAGFSVDESLSAMNGVLLLSQATLTDVAFTSDVIASNLRAFGLEAMDATRMSNVFAAAITNSQATMDKLAFSLRQVAPAAAAMGAELEQVTAQLSELYNIGLRGEQAGTQLRNIYVRLARPVGGARDLLRQFNIQTTQANGQLRDLRDILVDLGNAGLSTPQLAQIFGVEGVAGGIALIEAAMTGSLDQMQDSITGTNRAFELFVRQLDTFDGAMNLARNAVQDLFLTIGEQGAGILQEFAQYIRELIVSFNELDESTRESIVRWVAWTAVTVAAFGILRAVGTFVIGMVTSIARLLTTVAGWTTANGALATSLIAVRNAMAGVMAVNFLGAIQGIGFAVMTALPALFSFTSGLTMAGAAVAATVTGLGAVALAIIGVGGVIWGVRALTRSWRENRAASREAIQEAYNDLVRLRGLMDLGDTSRRLGTAEFDLQAAFNLYAGRAGSGLDFANATISVLRNSIQQERQALSDELANLQAELAADFPEFIAPVEEFFEQINEAEQRLQAARNRLAALTWRREGYEEAVADVQALEAEVAALYESFHAQAEAMRDPEFARAVAARQQRIEHLEEGVDRANAEFANALRNLTLGYNQFFDDIISSRIDTDSFIREGARDVVIQYLRENQAALVDGLVEGATGDDAEFLDIRALLERLRTDDTVPQEVRDALIDFTTAQLDQLVVNMDEVRATARDRARELALQIANARAQASDDLETELEAIRLREDQRLIQLVRGIVDEQTSGIESAFGELIQFGARLADDVLPFIEDLGISAEVSGLRLGEALYFSGFAEAVEDAVDSGASYEEVLAFAEGRRDEYIALTNAILQQMLVAGTLTDEVADTIRDALSDSSTNLIDAVNSALATLESSVSVARSRAASRASRGSRNRDPVEEARRARRQFEDALREIEGIRIQARRAQLDTGVFDIETRIGISMELDIADIRAQYDQQLTRLRRELDDINRRFEGQPLELNRLAESYRNIIREVEAARDAEIAYTQSFTAMVERRNQAIESQLVQIRNLAMEVEDGYGRVRAGIESGLLQYQRNLLTTVDTVAQYTVSILDGLSDAVGRWVTGQGDFLDMLRQTFLQASAELVTNATRRMLQELSMSVTSGTFNAGGQQVGEAANSGGLLRQGLGMIGGLLSGVFGGAGGTLGGQAATPMVGGIFQEHVTLISDSVNSYIQGTSLVYDTTIQNMDSASREFSISFNQALQSVVSAVSGPAGGATGSVGMLGSLFAGFFDSGGRIPRNQFGIVGERGAELVTGPANVVGRSDTSQILDRLIRDREESRPVNVVFNVSTPNVESFRKSRSQLSSDLTRALYVR